MSTCGNAIDACHTVAIDILGDKALGGANVECMGIIKMKYVIHQHHHHIQK
ncbi:MAG: hypothetical protein GY777_26210 [Candidatus Brocadiaceae bacterium]|nr:hypothetical protein [Candidatus Brocadiaceae bacterium]